MPTSSPGPARRGETMAARSTRQKIKDRVNSAIEHVVAAAEQLTVAMEQADDRSPPAYHLIPKLVEMILALRDAIENLYKML